MSQTYDAIIIGAGVMGASIAFHLAERNLKVAVLERKTIASGSTGHSSGLIRMHYDLAAEAELAFKSFQYFTNWHERVGGECGYIKTGFLQIAKREHEPQLRGNVAIQQKIGINTNIITADEVKKLAPDFLTDQFDFAAYEPDSGHGDATLSTSSFLNAAKRNGTTVIQGCAVTAVQASGGRVTGVATTQGKFSAPIIVNAAGPWAAQVAHLFGIEIPIVTWTHEVAFLHRPLTLGPFPAVIDDTIGSYFRPEGETLILAAGEEDSMRGDSPDEESQTPTPSFLDKLIDNMCKRMPKIEESGLQSIHVGRDGITPDQRPIWGAAGPEGAYLACGLSGTGFKISPAAGACMAELILDGEPTTVDIRPFRLERFAEDQLLKGEFEYGNGWK